MNAAVALVAATAAAVLASAVPVLADDTSLCQSQARSVERDLGMRRDQMSLEQRMRAHQRLSAADTLCQRDPARASRDLRGLQRDMVQQSRLPTLPDSNRPGGLD